MRLITTIIAITICSFLSYVAAVLFVRSLSPIALVGAVIPVVCLIQYTREKYGH